MRRRNELAVLPKLPLLITESADEFDALRDAFEREIKPRGIVEQMYVPDISSIVWEILRLRRCKVVIINAAFRSALQELLGADAMGRAARAWHLWRCSTATEGAPPCRNNILMRAGPSPPSSRIARSSP